MFSAYSDDDESQLTLTTAPGSHVITEQYISRCIPSLLIADKHRRLIAVGRTMNNSSGCPRLDIPGPSIV